MPYMGDISLQEASPQIKPREKTKATHDDETGIKTYAGLIQTPEISEACRDTFEALAEIRWGDSCLMCFFGRLEIGIPLGRRITLSTETCAPDDGIGKESLNRRMGIITSIGLA